MLPKFSNKGVIFRYRIPPLCKAIKMEISMGRLCIPSWGSPHRLNFQANNFKIHHCLFSAFGAQFTPTLQNNTVILFCTKLYHIMITKVLLQRLLENTCFKIIYEMIHVSHAVHAAPKCLTRYASASKHKPQPFSKCNTRFAHMSIESDWELAAPLNFYSLISLAVPLYYWLMSLKKTLQH